MRSVVIACQFAVLTKIIGMYPSLAFGVRVVVGVGEAVLVGVAVGKASYGM